MRSVTRRLSTCLRIHPSRPAGRALPGVLLGLIVATGCSDEALFGPGAGAEAGVNTPAGVQTGDVAIVYSLKHDDITMTNISASYSPNGGSTYVAASEATGSEGKEDLSVSPGGDTHTFVWDAEKDLGRGRHSEVKFRITPRGGRKSTTDGFPVHNSVFLVVTYDQDLGQVGMYELHRADGALSSIRTVSTGGRGPFGIVYRDGYFYVAHETSNDVAALELDGEGRTLAAVEGSPFSTGGVGSKYLVASGDLLFVGNAGGNTISIFDIGDGGELVANRHSGEVVTGVRSMVARGSRLYVASETADEIIVFDIESDGELLESAYSPISSGGVDAPRGLTRLGSRLYATSATSATLGGWSFLGGGDLSPLTGSPFSFTDAGSEQVVDLGARLIVAGGASGSVTVLDVDTSGIPTEAPGSPVSTTGTLNGLVATGSVIVAGDVSASRVRVWTIDDLGQLSAVSGSPFTVAAPVARLAVSE